MRPCPHCGARNPAPSARDGGSPIFALGLDAVRFRFASDATKDGLRELTDEAKSAPPELARIIRIIRDRLALQDRTASVIERGLGDVFRAIIDALRDLLAARPEEAVADRARALRVNGDFLRRLLEQVGLGDLIDEVASAAADLANLGAEGQAAGGVETETRVVGGRVVAQASVSAIAAAAADLAEQFWERAIIRPTTERLMGGLKSSISGESLDATIARLRRDLDMSIPQATTEARTQIAEFDRAVVAQSGAEAGAEFYAYLGPVDGITRGFCAELAGLVLTRAQIGRLDNAQTATSPLFSGGGYNCRHQFSPLTKGLAVAMGLQFATDDNIDRANARARASR